MKNKSGCERREKVNWPCDAYLHNNNTALIKQISLFVTALVMSKT